MKKVKFDIQGMTCSSCSSHVAKEVNKLEGIQNVNVNLLSNNMVVYYDENILDNEKIIQAVVNAGYGASVHEKAKETKRKEEKRDLGKENIKSMKKRLIISIGFLIPLMYLAMHHMLKEWFGLPVPQIVETLFHGNENGVTFGFTQFLLLLPIIYVNRNYFIIGFKRLFKGTPNMDSLIAIGSMAATIYGIFAIYMIGYGLGHNKMEIVEQYSIDIYFEACRNNTYINNSRKIFRSKIKGKNK